MKIHFIVTGLWAVFAVGMGAWLGWEDLTPNEFGDFLAGASGPVAFYWFIVTTFMQRRELALQRQELALTRSEMARQAAAQEEQADLARTRVRADRERDQRKALEAEEASLLGRLLPLAEKIARFKELRSPRRPAPITFHALDAPARDPDAVRAFAESFAAAAGAWKGAKAEAFGPLPDALTCTDGEAADALEAEWAAFRDWYAARRSEAGQVEGSTFAASCHDIGADTLFKALAEVYGRPVPG